jgi:hypothetical protein
MLNDRRDEAVQTLERERERSRSFSASATTMATGVPPAAPALAAEVRARAAGDARRRLSSHAATPDDAGCAPLTSDTAV